MNRNQPQRASPAEQLRQSQGVDEKLMRFKEIQFFVTRTAKRCFGQCVNDFETSTLSQTEKSCIDNCIVRAQRSQAEVGEVMTVLDQKYKD